MKGCPRTFSLIFSTTGSARGAGALEEAGHRARAEAVAEDVGEEFAEPLAGHQLVGVQVDDHRAGAPAVLGGCVDSLGECGFDLLRAARAGAGLGAVLGDLDGDLLG